LTQNITNASITNTTNVTSSMTNATNSTGITATSSPTPTSAPLTTGLMAVQIKLTLNLIYKTYDNDPFWFKTKLTQDVCTVMNIGTILFCCARNIVVVF
jgi:hypothetical protein